MDDKVMLAIKVVDEEVNMGHGLGVDRRNSAFSYGRSYACAFAFRLLLPAFRQCQLDGLSLSEFPA